MATELLAAARIAEGPYIPPAVLFVALGFELVQDAPPACRGVALIAKGVVRCSPSPSARRQDDVLGHEGGHLVCVLGGELEPHDEQRLVLPAGLALRIPRSSILRAAREDRRDPRLLCERYPRMHKLDVFRRLALTGDFDVFVRTGHRFRTFSAHEVPLEREMEVQALMDTAVVLGRFVEDEQGAVAVEMRVSGRPALVAVVPRE